MAINRKLKGDLFTGEPLVEIESKDRKIDQVVGALERLGNYVDASVPTLLADNLFFAVTGTVGATAKFIQDAKDVVRLSQASVSPKDKTPQECVAAYKAALRVNGESFLRKYEVSA